MKLIRWTFVLALLAGGCAAAPTTTVAPQAAVDAPRFSLLHTSSSGDDLWSIVEEGEGCGTVNGTGDSHPGDGKFYELSFASEELTAATKGTIALYVMNDVLFGDNPMPEPDVYEGTVTSQSIKNNRAVLKGYLANGKPFKLRIEDNVTDAISEGGPYDYFWFSTEGLNVEKAFIHEGDFVVTPVACPSL